MKKLLYLTIIVILIASCNNANIEEEILGTWETSFFIDSEKSKTMFGAEDGIDNGVDIELTLKSTDQFIKGKRYNSNGYMKFVIRVDDQEIPFKLGFKESGTWEFNDNILVTTTDDIKINPLDRITKNLIEEFPEFKAVFEQVKGESSTNKIIKITKEEMQIKSEDLPDMLLTYYKK